MGAVGVVGCGLIGGSLLRALHAAPSPPRLVGIDSDEATRRAVAQALGIETGATPDERLRDCDVVVLALPVPVLLQELGTVSSLLAGTSAVLTDTAGIKAPVLQAAERMRPRPPFVGAHPMAGKERGGFARSQADLFNGKPVAICSAEAVPEGATARVEAMWRAAGARTLRCGAAEHDEAVARASHLPYLVACALSRVAAQGPDLARRLAAGGLRDTTRVAEDPTIRHAVRLNRDAARLARQTADELKRLADALDEGTLDDGVLDEAARARRDIFS